MNQNSPKYVALTFDDGPSAYTAAVLKVLKDIMYVRPFCRWFGSRKISKADPTYS